MKEVKELIEAYADKYNEFTSETLKRFSNGENLVFSPLSIFVLLSMAADSVNGAARQEILDDPKLNDILKSMPGAKIVDISQK